MQIHLDDEQLLCLQVCVQNAPTPYDIGSKKPIRESIQKMIGIPPKIEVEPLRMPKYDLTRFGIHD